MSSLQRHPVRSLSHLVLPLAALVMSGCAIGPIEHQGYQPAPGENLVVDVARAVERFERRVMRTGYQEPPLDPRRHDAIPHEMAPGQASESIPPGPRVEEEIPWSDAPPEHYVHAEPTAVSPHCEGDRPIIAPPPPVGPPGRFFPVPTRPVFGP